jgi:hypothetical protein
MTARTPRRPPDRNRRRRTAVPAVVAVLLVLVGALSAAGPGLARRWGPTDAPRPEIIAEMSAPSTADDPPPVVAAGGPVEVRLPAAAGAEVRITRPPSFGTASLAGPGTATYAADDGYAGKDAFGYVVCRDRRCSPATATITVVPPGLSRFSPRRAPAILDTRAGTGRLVAPGTTVGAELPGLDARVWAVMLSVTVLDSLEAGVVEVDGGRGPVPAARVGAPQGAATNTVTVPLAPPGGAGDRRLAVRTGPGGHVVVDLVGAFEATTVSSAGRFVATDATRVAHLETARDGREASIDLSAAPGLPAGQVGAALALVTADVGANGGHVGLGARPGAPDRQLQWGPGGTSPQRRALALLVPGEDGRVALRYDGGSKIDVDLVGVFTNARADAARTGLFVPTVVRPLHRGPLDPDRPETAALPASATAALVNVTATAGVPPADLGPDDLAVGSGRLTGTVLAARDGQVTLRSSAPLADASVDLLGTFVDVPL